jgi:hypothetical protein
MFVLGLIYITVHKISIGQYFVGFRANVDQHHYSVISICNSRLYRFTLGYWISIKDWFTSLYRISIKNWFTL